MEGGRIVAVIGGGAAGFFAALSAAEHHPHAQVVLFEKSNKLLAKVKGDRIQAQAPAFPSNALITATSFGNQSHEVFDPHRRNFAKLGIEPHSA